MIRTFSTFTATRPMFVRFFIACWLMVFQAAIHAQETVPAIVSNASASELRAVQSTLDDLLRAVEARDANALTFYSAAPPADDSPLRLTAKISHVAVAPAGALVRQEFSLSIQRTPAVVLSQGTQDLWLSRAPGGTFALTPRRFAAPPDAMKALLQAASAEWNNGETAPAVLDLVASRIGGRWIALRRQRWEGELASPTETDNIQPPTEFLTKRMAAAPKNKAVIAHFVFQRGLRNWFGIGAAFNPARRISALSDSAASLWRQRIEGEDFTLASSHRDFGQTLSEVNLWEEAADEFQKAELLQPGIVGAAKLREAEANRLRDPQVLVAKQIENEQKVGLGAEHPYYLINALQREQQNAPTVLVALRLALVYSRLADETRVAAWMRTANDLMARGAVRPRDAAWVQLLSEHIRERTRLVKEKPPIVLRSSLFTVRVWPREAGAISMLAALEEAQHTVYADFAIPMGNTEVILWRDQAEFARYTTQFSEEGGGEFVAALTLTKLVTTAGLPFILGEEFNTFIDKREPGAVFSTVAHEYGHVAVRNLSHGYMVPVWFNEGIASSVEGGYEGYINRVRRAANAGALLSMDEMLDWKVDGERAFLAYSQANSIIDYIALSWGKAAVLDILRQIGRNSSPDEAFRAVIGMSQAELWERWVQEGIR
ncbi:MAG TPA: peptidase MA family metallohydrolase [Abditibacterium sp.]